MTDQCGNCGSTITDGTAFRVANPRKDPTTTAVVNFVAGTDYSDLCAKCGDDPVAKAYHILDEEIRERSEYVRANITVFPMFTLSWLPGHVNVRLKSMVTANVTVGTGLFNEFSQGFSDMIGAVNTETGMSHKVNKGEAAARSILVEKAIGMGANCLLGVDVDYGTTATNAATINMQATAVLVTNLDEILDTAELERSAALGEAYARILQLRRWRAGRDIPEQGRGEKD